MTTTSPPAIWFPTVRTNTGTDVFTERLVEGLWQRGLRAEITWLPLRAEYAPWTVPVPKPPLWANIAHINTWLHSRFLPRQLPVIATLHHSIHDPALRPYKGFVRATYHRWWIASNERRVMRWANRVVTVSQFAADIARQTLIDLPMDVIYNGIDTERFRPPQGGSRPHQPFRLLFIGSWMARKGVDLLAPIMRELGDGFELHYTGGSAAECDKPNMPANMHDTGRLSGDEVAGAMQNADAFLFPSRSEGLPLVGIEAMACGLPIIAMRASSLVEIVEERRTGLLCSANEVLAFAAACRTLADNHALHEAMARAARARALDLFSMQRMIEAYIQVYTTMANVAPRMF